MGDITTSWNVQAGEGDWTLVPGDLQGGDDLETSVLISLFTDRRADPSDVVPDGSNDRRGWWGDLGATVPIGSRLWLLRRAKQIDLTLQMGELYAGEALAWLVQDLVAAKVDVACSFPALGVLGFSITLYDQAGLVLAQYQWAWQGLS